VFNAEIPLDGDTQASMMGKLMLPRSDLHQLVGEDVFARIVRVVGKALMAKFPQGPPTFSLRCFADETMGGDVSGGAD
jgi:hypothetical protein